MITFLPEEQRHELADVLVSIFSREELAKLNSLLIEEFPETQSPEVLSEERMQEVLVGLLSKSLSINKLEDLTKKVVPGEELSRRLRRHERRYQDDYEPYILNSFDEQVTEIMQVQDRRRRVRFLQYCLRAARRGVVIFEWWQHFRERLRDKFYYVGDLSVAGLLIVLVVGAATGISAWLAVCYSGHAFGYHHDSIDDGH